MRKDLNKLLCERERRGSKNHFRHFRKLKTFTHARGEEFEDLPSRESMKVRYDYHYHRKEFGENLNPLYGFVRKCVGKKWDDSFSELCEVFDMKSVINNHILEHLWWAVERFVEEVDGELYYRRYRGSSLSPVFDEDGPEYYVHPRTGILLKNPAHLTYRQRRNTRNKAWRAQKGNTDDRKIINDSLEMRRRNDVWFLCEIESFPPRTKRLRKDYLTGEMKEETVESQRYDMWLHRTIDYHGTPVYMWDNRTKPSNPSRRGTFVKSVKTASHKELKEHGLK